MYTHCREVLVMIENVMEAEAIRSRFEALCKRLAITGNEAQVLMSGDMADTGHESAAVHRETCMRLLLELEPLLVELFGAEGLVAWLRRDNLGQSPLTFLGEGPSTIRAMILAARSELSQAGKR